MPEIHVGLIKDALMTQSPNGVPIAGITKRVIKLTLPTNPETIDYERKQTPYFWLESVKALYETGRALITSHENPLLTPCAGAVSVFRDDSESRYVSFSQKDPSAPRDPGFRVPRNGFPSSVEDWRTMAHLYREAWEEGIILTRESNELVLPEDSQYDETIYHVANMMCRKTGLTISGTKRVPIKFLDGNDLLEIYQDSKLVSTHRGIISWTPETGFNFIKIMDVNYPIAELKIIGGETLPNGDPIGRNVCVIDLKELQGKKFGDRIRETVHQYERGKVRIYERSEPFLADKVPRSVLNQILVDGQPVYYVDWMEESREFLANPLVLRDFSRFRWSDLERRLKLR